MHTFACKRLFPRFDVDHTFPVDQICNEVLPHAVRDITNNVAQNAQNEQRNANQQLGLVNANVPVNANLDLN
jgi:hypothetical protein